MSLPSEHKALLFLGAVAALGAGVRVARAIGHQGVGVQPALEQQMQAADSSKRAGVAKQRARKSAAAGRVKVPAIVVAPPGWSSRIGGRLDLDVATAAQIDSLPGIGPALARRIVVERMSGGPFTKLVSLKRVKGVTLKVLEQIDSLVTFSGTVVPPNPADTIIPRGRRGRTSRPGDDERK
jgi:competence protein ComEA